MSGTIAISFAASQEYRDHIYRRVMNERSYGATPGDSFWMGYQDFDEVDPFARYREEEESRPITVKPWRDRIEKAKRDIEKHKAEFRVRDVADSMTVEEITKDIEVIRAWARSLQRTQPQTGSLELTQAGHS